MPTKLVLYILSNPNYNKDVMLRGVKLKYAKKYYRGKKRRNARFS